MSDSKTPPVFDDWADYCQKIIPLAGTIINQLKVNLSNVSSVDLSVTHSLYTNAGDNVLANAFLLQTQYGINRYNLPYSLQYETRLDDVDRHVVSLILRHPDVSYCFARIHEVGPLLEQYSPEVFTLFNLVVKAIRNWAITGEAVKWKIVQVELKLQGIVSNQLLYSTPTLNKCFGRPTDRAHTWEVVDESSERVYMLNVEYSLYHQTITVEVSTRLTNNGAIREKEMAKEVIYLKDLASQE